MSFSSWLRSWKSTLARTSSGRSRRRPTSWLAVEQLEDRTLLTAGALDRSFGLGGKVTTDLGFRSPSDDYAQAVQADGSLDTGFGDGGKATIGFGSPGEDHYDLGYGVAVGSQDRIVVAGCTDNYTSGTGYDFAVARLNADGSLDTGFDDDGRQTIDFGSPGEYQNDFGNGVAVDSQDRILLAGWAHNHTSGTGPHLPVGPPNTHGQPHR